MNVSTLQIPKDKAIVAYKEYRAAVRENPNKEDRICMMGYRAIAQGKSVIDVREAIHAAGLDQLNRPKLCLGRADWPAVVLPGWQTGDVTFRNDRWSNAKDIVFRNLFPGVYVGGRGHFQNRSQTPMIPPRIRPATKNLSSYFILWEAAWEHVTRDPYLLKPLGGNLYVVLAAWDLTDLERSVMAARPQ